MTLDKAIKVKFPESGASRFTVWDELGLKLNIFVDLKDVIATVVIVVFIIVCMVIGSRDNKDS